MWSKESSAAAARDSRFSAAEVGSQDLWQRAEVGFCMVATSEDDIQTVFSHIEDEIERLALADVLDQDTEFLHYS